MMIPISASAAPLLHIPCSQAQTQKPVKYLTGFHWLQILPPIWHVFKTKAVITPKWSDIIIWVSQLSHKNSLHLLFLSWPWYHTHNHNPYSFQQQQWLLNTERHHVIDFKLIKRSIQHEFIPGFIFSLCSPLSTSGKNIMFSLPTVIKYFYSVCEKMSTMFALDSVLFSLINGFNFTKWFVKF